MAANNQIVKYENVSDQVLAKIKSFQEVGLQLPANYAVDNAMKAAWLILQETEDKNHNKALEVCTKESIANSLLDMVLQGLSVHKKQGYFLVYGSQLSFQRSYFGTVALAKRTGEIKKEPVANIIYEGDEFVYTIDPETGLKSIIKHDQKIENINSAKIKAAYCILQKEDGTRVLEIMTIDQIRKAWAQGATKGNSPAHQNFTDEMCKKTVIGRACKMIINSSDDAWLYEGKQDEFDAPDNSVERRNAAVQGGQQQFIEQADFEEVKAGSQEASQTQGGTVAGAQQENVPEAAKQADTDAPY
jgi:recombination protein RecT